MSDRQLLLETIQKMPDSATMPELMDELRLLTSVQEGLEESDREEGVPHAHVAQLLDEWITKSSGPRAA
jgi:predicted transcriptional regulator